MSGLGNIEMRQVVWEKQYWKGADSESDQKLDFDDVEKLCKRLHINSPADDLLRLFKVGVLALIAATSTLNFVVNTAASGFARPELPRFY
jgi:hypothetical protein